MSDDEGLTSWPGQRSGATSSPTGETASPPGETRHADVREATADEREQRADDREADLDELEQRLDVVPSSWAFHRRGAKPSGNAPQRSVSMLPSLVTGHATSDNGVPWTVMRAAADRDEAATRREAATPTTQLALAFAEIARHLYQAEDFDDVLTGSSWWPFRRSGVARWPA